MIDGKGDRRKKGDRERKREREETAYAGPRPRYRTRYTWIIDFVHELATTGASKIPVALLIVVNCLLCTASFQMRFRRSPSPRARTTSKSNCDSSRYRCPLIPPRSYHPNRTFLHTMRPQPPRQEIRSRTRSLFSPPCLFPPVAFTRRVLLSLPFFYCLPNVSFLFFSSAGFTVSPFSYYYRFLSTYIMLCYPLSFFTCCLNWYCFLIILFLSSCLSSFMSFLCLTHFLLFIIEQFAVSSYAPREKKSRMTDWRIRPENFVLVAASGWNFRRVC